MGQQTERIPPMMSKLERRGLMDWLLGSPGMERERTMSAMVTIGPLLDVSLESGVEDGIRRTDLIQNIQRQVVLSAITPPRMGPRRLARANTDDMIPE